MSDRGSPSEHTSNTSFINNSRSVHSTSPPPPRLELYDRAGNPHTLAGPSHTRTHSSIYHTDASSSRPSHTRLSEDSPDQQRPRKKMRRQDSEERGGKYNGGSTPSESSEDEQENEVHRGQLSESPAPTSYEFAVPKKKRTRTLTTPHQAAVLHALMAQVGLITCESLTSTQYHVTDSISNDGHERGCWKADWVDCSESAGEQISLPHASTRAHGRL